MSADDQILLGYVIDLTLLAALAFVSFTSYYGEEIEFMASMPNRSVKVNAMCRAHPEAFPPGDANDPARLAFLKSTIIPTLNVEDGGKWGYMTKTDQGGKVPCDILMWADTNQVVDCMTGTGGAWVEHGQPPPEWVWTSVGGTPTPQPPSDAVQYDEARSVRFGTACNKTYAECGAPPDAGMIAVHAERDAYDFYAMRLPDPECMVKHVNEFRAVYGLPPLKAK